MISEDEMVELVEKVIGKPLEAKEYLLDNGILDSLKTLDLINLLEDHCSIEIDLDEVNHFQFNSIANLVELVKNASHQ